MSEEWKRPLPWQVRAIPLGLLVVMIAVAFAYMERQRTKRSVAADLRFFELLLDGPAALVDVLTPHVTVDHWERITSVKTLRKVDLSKVETLEEGLEPLTLLPSLEWLRLQGRSFVDDAQIKWLAGALPLKRLHVEQCYGVTDDAVTELIGWESLKEVRVGDTSITWAGLARLREARRDLRIFAFHRDWPIANLSFYDLDTQADAEDVIKKMNAVLELRHNWQTGDWQEDPASQFEKLYLSGDAAGAVLPELAAVLGHVNSLSISGTRITGDVGSWSTKLTSLFLSDLTAGSDMSGFANCTSLTSVTIGWGTYVNAASLEWLTELPDLKVLEISEISPTTADMEVISHLASLETLNLTKVNDETIGPLLEPDRLPRLRELRLWDQAVSTETLFRLKTAYPAVLLSSEFVDGGIVGSGNFSFGP